jgi:hypothetical protein
LKNQVYNFGEADKKSASFRIDSSYSSFDLDKFYFLVGRAALEPATPCSAYIFLFVMVCYNNPIADGISGWL